MIGGRLPACAVACLLLALPSVPAALPDDTPLTDAVAALHAFIGVEAPFDRDVLASQERIMEEYIPGLAAAAAYVLQTGMDPSATPEDLVQAALAVTAVPLGPGTKSLPVQVLPYRAPFNLVVIGGHGDDHEFYTGHTGGTWLSDRVPQQMQALTIDIGGKDRYTNTAGGVPAGSALTFSVSIDLATQYEGADTADDTYDCTAWACTLPAQGAASGPGTGILIDHIGSDTYLALAPGALAQGSGDGGGYGYFTDRGGNDRYETDRGQGFGRQGGTGHFIDTYGDDHYTALQGMGSATARDSPAGARATFVDLGAGRDMYIIRGDLSAPYEACPQYSYDPCLIQSATGAAVAGDAGCSGDCPAMGGCIVQECTNTYAQFLDDGGDDSYQIPRHVRAFGMGTLYGPGFFADLGGWDQYGYAVHASNNGIWWQSAVSGSPLPAGLGYPGGIGIDEEGMTSLLRPLYAGIDHFLNRPASGSIMVCASLEFGEQFPVLDGYIGPVREDECGGASA